MVWKSSSSASQAVGANSRHVASASAADTRPKGSINPDDTSHACSILQGEGAAHGHVVPAPSAAARPAEDPPPKSEGKSMQCERGTRTVHTAPGTGKEGAPCLGQHAVPRVVASGLPSRATAPGQKASPSRLARSHPGRAVPCAKPTWQCPEGRLACTSPPSSISAGCGHGRRHGARARLSPHSPLEVGGKALARPHATPGKGAWPASGQRNARCQHRSSPREHRARHPSSPLAAARPSIRPPCSPATSSGRL